MCFIFCIFHKSFGTVNMFQTSILNLVSGKIYNLIGDLGLKSKSFPGLFFKIYSKNKFINDTEFFIIIQNTYNMILGL